MLRDAPTVGNGPKASIGREGLIALQRPRRDRALHAQGNGRCGPLSTLYSLWWGQGAAIHTQLASVVIRKRCAFTLYADA